MPHQPAPQTDAAANLQPRRAAVAFDILEIVADLLDAAANITPVGFEHGFTGATRANAGCARGSLPREHSA